ncbi:peptide ABC transporter ATP-binding protein [Candidatus Saganbacteria bacterium CG08_land_8_20_14_0_20_45_16]|uniref:Peptide ABC transporter ATP-binding protein n=1 Tax=Candidatus Saganbacteria bacterium CG08_land_8_20_14_0_20_45_16 TaxID=2014293 RepID=A0A2H0XZG5_UNCSA|nr:MAG: peptide ABC transporter ATP-binding protein [Candidatus Saganbacteria bacterium CG08_land_8_20_14_0_20_45_16]
MLEVKNLSTYFFQDNEVVKAVGDVSFSLEEGEILGILGESGSGKSTIAHSILKLVYPPGKIVSGEIIFNGQDLLKLAEEETIEIRGAKISMIFQDPFSSLNPVLTVGEQIAEVISLHQGLSRRAAWNQAIEMLKLVKIKDSALRIKDYPHQFSGGMRQRVMIAMALACQPELLIADEPTTALDVTIQAEILSLLAELQQKLKLSIIYITHNFGIIKALCRRVIVLQAGRVVEAGQVSEIMDKPAAAYTAKLIKALSVMKQKGEKSNAI